MLRQAWHEIPRAIPVARCYDAAVAMKRKKKKKTLKGYVLKWRGRASMSNKLWASKDKKLAAKWKTCLRNMAAKDYEKLFPDSYSWVKKFAEPMKTRTGVKMWQVCRSRLRNLQVHMALVGTNHVSIPLG